MAQARPKSPEDILQFLNRPAEAVKAHRYILTATAFPHVVTYLLLILVLFASGYALADKSASEAKSLLSDEQVKQQYERVNLAAFIRKNHVSKQMADKKQRTMLPPALIQFKGRLMAAAKPGKFSLVYDAINLWAGGDQPAVTHSAFIGAEDGRVIGSYVTQSAAVQMKGLEVGGELIFYALHLYNYAKGPRVLILAVTGDSVETEAQVFTNAGES